MKVSRNVSLKDLNTFGIDAKANQLIEVHSVEDVKAFCQDDAFQSVDKLVLGGGSNILLTQDFDGVVVLNKITGKEVIREDEQHVYVKIGGGEVWHEFVLWAIENHWAGIENLSLIPGSVGAAPMQNIGAYGVEIKDTFFELEAVNRQTGEVEVFDLETCQFGYRSSIFKTSHKDQYIIANVTFRLNKTPQFNTSYGAIQSQLEANGIKELSIKAVSDAVIQIRESKLPDPKEIGNSGSFFKNPVVDKDTFEQLFEKYPDVAHYPLEDGTVKLAAGWLIDKGGWKGKQFGDYGVHKRQALVLVNYANATGSQIYQLSEDIKQDIKAKFGVDLEREVNII